MSSELRYVSGKLVDVSTGSDVQLRSGRGPRVLMMPHPPDCADCQAYVERLAGNAGEIAEWGGRLSIVSNDPAHAAPLLERHANVQVVTDPDGRLNASAPALVIADEWGEVRFAADGAEDHALPDMREVTEWVRFVAVHCPECEQPEGEWRTVE